MSLVQYMIVFTSFLAFTTEIYGQNQCTTPSNTRGACVPLDQCPYMAQAFQLSLDEPTKSYLRKSVCKFQGYRPIVCCETDYDACVSPKGKPGACMPLSRCDPILTLLETKPFLPDHVTNYISNSECEVDSLNRYKYCCPIFHKII